MVLVGVSCGQPCCGWVALSHCPLVSPEGGCEDEGICWQLLALALLWVSPLSAVTMSLDELAGGRGRLSH